MCVSGVCVCLVCVSGVFVAGVCAAGDTSGVLLSSAGVLLSTTSSSQYHSYESSAGDRFRV